LGEANVMFLKKKIKAIRYNGKGRSLLITYADNSKRGYIGKVAVNKMRQMIASDDAEYSKKKLGI